MVVTIQCTLNAALSGSFINQKLFFLHQDGGKPVQKSPGDLGLPMTGRERSEYIRWKRERDQIDLERLARHKNAKGEWRRAWDVEKSEHM